MQRIRGEKAGRRAAAEPARWSRVLRALRQARGLTQDGWALRLGVSRATVARWESGERAPDPGAEAALVAFCRKAGLLRVYDAGPLAGLTLTAETLQDLLAEARWQMDATAGRHQPAPEPAGPATTGPDTFASHAEDREEAAGGAHLLRSRQALLSNLPVPLTNFVGREQEIAAIRRALGGTRLLALTGAGGCGKTRLALELAGELLWAYPHGVWWVELAALVEPALVPETVAAALGLRTTGERPVTEVLAEHLAPRQLLLILDNCEHLLPACAALIETLLRACPHLGIVLTSREPLGIVGETVWRVPPLSPTDAASLFVERARLYQPHVALPMGTRTAIDEICVQLDGLPLAIELAAARLNVLTVEQIAARLSDRFRLLIGGSRTALPRQQTLRAAMDWSYDLLTAPEQALLRWLSVFAGGFTLEAVEAVCGEDLLDILGHLVDKSLVNARRHDGGVRYGLLETVRQYAGERLDEAGEATARRQRHREWCIALAEQAELALLGPEQAAWLSRLEEEHDNLRAALAWSLTQEKSTPALRLAGALARFWERRGYLSEGRAWLARALSTGDDAHAEALAKTLHGAGVLATLQGDYVAAHALHERSLAIYRELKDGRGIAEAQGNLGRVMLRQGEYAVARALLEASLALHRELGNEPGVASVLGILGQLALREGNHASARANFESRLAMLRDVGNTDGIADALEDLATVAGEQGDVVQQTALLEEARVLFREIGSTSGSALVLGNLGLAAWMQRDPVRALSLLEESLALYREIGDRRGMARALGNQAFVALYRREYVRAAACCREALALYRDIGEAWAVGRYLPVLAGAAFAQGQVARAARLFSAAAALRERLSSPLPPVVQATHDRAVAAVRAALGSPAFEREWAQGHEMSPEAVLADALGDAEPG